MDECHLGCVHPFATELERFRDFPGAIRADGSTIREPYELTEAKTVLGICDRFKVLPSQVLQEDISLLRWLKIEALGVDKEGGPGGDML